MPTADLLAQELAPVAEEVLAKCEVIAAAAKKDSDLFARAPQDVLRTLAIPPLHRRQQHLHFFRMEGKNFGMIWSIFFANPQLHECYTKTTERNALAMSAEQRLHHSGTRSRKPTGPKRTARRARSRSNRHSAKWQETQNTKSA